MTLPHSLYRNLSLYLFSLLALAFLAAIATARSQEQTDSAPDHPAMPVAIHGDTVYTMDGAPIADGLVLIRDGKITFVGSAQDTVYTADHRVLRAKVVTPGLIDARATVGLSGILNQDQDQDMLEKSAAMQPELRAIDAYNPRDPLVAYVRSFGITTVNTGHAPGMLISGQTMVVKTHGRTSDEDVIQPAAMIAASLGSNGTTSEAGKTPGTRSKAVALLRAELIKAQAYVEKLQAEDESKRPARDLRLETLARALDGTQPLLITAHRQQDILSAIRIAREFNLAIILDGVSDAPLVLAEIKASGFPVILHPTMARSFGDQENLSMETAAKLKAAGIPFALQSGYENYVPKTRIVLFEAAIAAAHGLAFEDALACLTRDAAKLLGIADRTGSLTVGKDADLALYDGDPFEYTTHCTATVVDGTVYPGENYD